MNDARALRESWQRDGFVVRPGFRPPAQLAELRERAAAIVEAFDPGAHKTVFATHDQARRSTDAAFLASAGGVHCFFEEEALDAAGQLVVPKARAINKIGHALHDLDPVFDRFSHGPDWAALAAALGLARPLVMQSMLIFKQPGIGGEVRWHQDATFLHTEPVSVVGFWIALEDATRDNGCLWVQPGGHRGPLRERFRLQAAGLDAATRLDRIDSTAWPALENAQPLEVEAGTLVAFHGLLPHYSAANRSSASRLAYTLHAVDAASAWSADNWLQRPAAMPPRGFDGRPA